MGRPKTRLKKILQLLLSPLPEHAIIELPLPLLYMLPTDNKDYSPALLQISVYLDSLQTGQGAGFGYTVYFGPILVTKGHGPAGPRTEVYDAEIIGAVEGLRAALGQPCMGYSTQLVILLDNLAAASLLASYRPTLHRHRLSESFGQLATQPWKPLQVCWIPGHSGIAGNKLADKLAKLGSSIYSPNIPPSPAYLQRETKQQLRTETYTAYASKAPQAYKTLDIRPHTKESRTREHKLPRWVLGRLVAARTGHGDFTAYHQRFNHSDYLESCSCGRTKTPVHFFFCPYTRKRWKDRWRYIRDGPSKTIDWLLSTAAGAEEFSHIVQESSFFKDICPNWARRSA
ncbi:hypothetical protein AN3980.2 [Aspergillus nidulans FGSC A4]|uniref:RNase H type-1 domain-containing protein n=1 Tax=Emericella nidulans (strain FGSC A4 / ATCC 38163 / CBS 112.46 / NRRL 194 / M139) TaxID=227321 RepID=Q5B650_EMENI|nr:hypothetical protein [Aspergillus nidulans FGSC A4]EAA59451.1 hypothetical protein AN3980.2 [Aspergillus nidulans FGSC A4]CBF74958.1 TPA: conserved hypothetical protein [Aspergillus nidulans FGSC A4]|eukprot:XP_661584.1 hypothetical protein AN3980.2 [Aspergillus nidulans FGSC A4]